MPAEKIVRRLQRAVVNLLQWSEKWEPRTLSEREAYDDDLDEAEDVIAAAEAWIARQSEQWPLLWRKKEP